MNKIYNYIGKKRFYLFIKIINLTSILYLPLYKDILE
jgi:hypothetical protein